MSINENAVRIGGPGVGVTCAARLESVADLTGAFDTVVDWLIAEGDAAGDVDAVCAGPARPHPMSTLKARVRATRVGRERVSSEATCSALLDYSRASRS
jgi:hypothetical protein